MAKRKNTQPKSDVLKAAQRNISKPRQKVSKKKSQAGCGTQLGALLLALAGIAVFSSIFLSSNGDEPSTTRIPRPSRTPRVTEVVQAVFDQVTEEIDFPLTEPTENMPRAEPITASELSVSTEMTEPESSTDRVINRETAVRATELGQQIDQSFVVVPGVIASRTTAYQDYVAVEMVVDVSFNRLVMAQRAMTVAQNVVGGFSEFSIIIQGDGKLIDYIWREGEWRTTELTPIDQPLVEIEVRDEPTSIWTLPPVSTSTSMPTRTPQPTVTSRPIQPQGQVRPGNCSTAVAMGLTDRQAAQWSHLDQDNDGVACYGD